MTRRVAFRRGFPPYKGSPGTLITHTSPAGRHATVSTPLRPSRLTSKRCMKLSTHTRAKVEAHYFTHRETYQRIWGKLDDIHADFQAADREGKKAYLKLSYINACISVQCPLHVHEEAFTRLANGEDLSDALESVNYNVQKEKYIKQTLENEELWSALVEYLTDGELHKAHKLALDEMKFVGTVKVPFTLAMLGFTEKMCLDANVCRLAGIDEIPTTVVVEKYERLCDGIQGLFGTLADLDPFHLQWVMFDFQRFNRTGMSDAMKNRIKSDKQVAYHRAWFDIAYGWNTAEIKSLIHGLA